MSVTLEVLGDQGLELTIQRVRCGNLELTTLMSFASCIARLGVQPFLLHQSGHTMFAAGLTQIAEVMADLAITIYATAL